MDKNMHRNFYINISIKFIGENYVLYQNTYSTNVKYLVVNSMVPKHDPLQNHYEYFYPVLKFLANIIFIQGFESLVSKSCRIKLLILKTKLMIIINCDMSLMVLHSLEASKFIWPFYTFHWHESSTMKPTNVIS